MNSYCNKTIPHPPKCAPGVSTDELEDQEPHHNNNSDKNKSRSGDNNNNTSKRFEDGDPDCKRALDAEP
ncbi:hypothetical protein AB3S75_000081 [Citrus x aurantiifolia]